MAAVLAGLIVVAYGVLMKPRRSVKIDAAGEPLVFHTNNDAVVQALLVHLPLAAEEDEVEVPGTSSSPS